jgi:Xaa-Pro aminopeptidase
MKELGYDALIVYGNNKVLGSLRYLTDYFPDRCGWTSIGPNETYLFDGAAFLLPLHGENALLLDKGMVLGKVVIADKVISGGFGAGAGLDAITIEKLLKETGDTGVIGIETWDRFPFPLFKSLQTRLPESNFKKSTIIEELRMVKSPLEVEIYRKAAFIGDSAHQLIVDLLREEGIGLTELRLIREAEYHMRSQDPIYEDACENSPSLINTGFSFGGGLLHLPHQSKTIQPGDTVHWDICCRYQGYSIDTSRTKVVGTPTTGQLKAYETTKEIRKVVLANSKPGVPAVKLVEMAKSVAQKSGYELMDNFLGHGIGLDPHERPDFVIEATPLKKNMVLAIEPRVVENDIYAIGVEDMVLVTDSGGESLTNFDIDSLYLDG